MSEHLRDLLWVVGIGLVVGTVMGVAVRRLRPNWCRSYAKFVQHKKWWLFLLGFVMFGFMACASWREGNLPWGLYFAVFSLAELVCFFWFGFKPLTPEMSKKIDEWDPTKLFRR